uniref:Putative homing endonuclease n=1 Tax=viral metagenome TaxID=1070528 RepID=A0A6M3XY15_9ZZZZ
MNSDTRGILIGMVFGDAYLGVGLRKTGYMRSEMSVVHSIVQKDYCEHKAALIRKHLNLNVNITVRKNGPGGKYKASCFCITHPYFKQLKRWLYPGGVKTFTSKALNMITPEGIALWYMDDGHARTNINANGWVGSISTDIATMCSEPEAFTIKEFFIETYGIDFKVRCDPRRPKEKQFYIQANTKQSREFMSLIQPYIIPSMMYKLAHVAYLDSHERQAPVGECKSCGNVVYEMRRRKLCTACYSRWYYQNVMRFRDNRNPSNRGFYKGRVMI